MNIKLKIDPIMAMTTVDHIRNNLINRILTITDKDFLVALNNLISVSSTVKEEIPLTKEQELMLQMSEDDILAGRIISQNDLKVKTKTWLDGRKSWISSELKQPKCNYLISWITGPKEQNPQAMQKSWSKLFGNEPIILPGILWHL